MSDKFPSPDEALGARLRPDAVQSILADATVNVLFDLTIQSGPQKGAVIGIGAGRLLLGNDLECDIVLHSQSGALRAMLSVLDERLSVTAIAGALFLNQLAVQIGESQAVAHGDILRLADISLLLNTHEPHSALASPDDTEQHDVSAHEIEAECEDVPTPELDAEYVNAVATATFEASPWPGRLFVAAGVCTSVVLIVAIAWQANEAALPTPDKGIKAGTGTVQQKEKAATVSPATPQALRAVILSEATDILQARHLNAGLRQDANGLLHLTVPAPNLPLARAAGVALLNDIGGLQRVEIRAADDFGTDGHELPAISISRSNDGIHVIENWSLPASAVFNGKNQIVVVSMLPIPSILTVSGRRFFQGAQFNANTVIERIDQDSVLVTINGERRTVAL
ncbi:MAG: FHA domain-containing protein [Pseudomonadota bacterium]